MREDARATWLVRLNRRAAEYLHLVLRLIGLDHGATRYLHRVLRLIRLDRRATRNLHGPVRLVRLDARRCLILRQLCEGGWVRVLRHHPNSVDASCGRGLRHAICGTRRALLQHFRSFVGLFDIFLVYRRGIAADPAEDASHSIDQEVTSVGHSVLDCPHGPLLTEVLHCQQHLFPNNAAKVADDALRYGLGVVLLQGRRVDISETLDATCKHRRRRGLSRSHFDAWVNLTNKSGCSKT
mmetsp:Transcript_10423/g.27619  ORF Transcript_10423/g.27619 Transcript_10423/m.27619 type:complete len:239 (+) Transcript_10423:709-1425(+)